MNFHPYWLSLKKPQRVAFAIGCDTTVGYLTLVAGGFKKPGETLCMLVEKASNGAVTCEELRPDVPWHVVRQPQQAAVAAANADAVA